MTMQATTDRRADLLERFERSTELPLLLLALAMLPLLLVPLLVDLPESVEAGFLAADWAIWAVFAVEYLVRLALTRHRVQFVRREWPDLLIIVLPFLRPLRIVRSARALRLLRLGRLAAVLSEISQEGRKLLTRHKLHYALAVTLLIVLAGAGLMLAVEESSASSIDSFGDALWWAVTTVTTVGYGDMFPVTAAGRAIAAVLMVAGIALFGVVAANLASLVLEREDETSPLDVAGLHAKLDEMLARLGTLETLLVPEPPPRE